VGCDLLFSFANRIAEFSIISNQATSRQIIDNAMPERYVALLVLS
jgi:hypothetical protein